MGRGIESAALVVDGYHAQEDGFSSLVVLFGAFGIWLGYPLADPLIGTSYYNCNLANSLGSR